MREYFGIFWNMYAGKTDKNIYLYVIYGKKL